MNYPPARPHEIVVKLDGKIIKRIVKDPTDHPRGVYWSYGGFLFAVKPVTFKRAGDKLVPYYEISWNTTEIYFEVRKKVGAKILTSS